METGSFVCNNMFCNQKEFVPKDFFNFEDDFERILYIFSHCKNSKFDVETTNFFFDQIMTFNYSPDVKLLTLLQFICSHDFDENSKFY